MTNKKVKILLGIVCAILLEITVERALYPEERNTVIMDISGTQEEILQVYYGEQPDSLDEISSVKALCGGSSEFHRIKLKWDGDFYNCVRLDFGDHPETEFIIKKLEYKRGNKSVDILKAYRQNNVIKSINTHDLQYEISSEGLKLISTGIDPYFFLDEDLLNQISVRWDGRLLIMWLSAILVFVLFRKAHLGIIAKTLFEVYREKRLLFSLTLDDFQVKYAGSYFGIIWAFVQPCCTILIFWFVFQVGLKSTPVENYPFILWLMGGLIPWFFFSEAWASATNVFLEYAYLVKKMVFKIEILPLVKIMSSLIVHLFFLAILFCVFWAYHFSPNPYMLQVFYYLFCMVILVLGLSFITSTVMVFFRDLGNILAIVLQFTMWLTPIMWNTELIPERLRFIFEINPMYYVVAGYRASMVSGSWVIEFGLPMIRFWGISLIVLIAGVNLFYRSKKHFADVL